jgi:hypothetical protein
MTWKNMTQEEADGIRALLKIKDDTIKALEKTVEELEKKKIAGPGIETIVILKKSGLDSYIHEASNLQTGERQMFHGVSDAIRHYNSYGFRVCGAAEKTVYMTREVKEKAGGYWYNGGQFEDVESFIKWLRKES